MKHAILKGCALAALATGLFTATSASAAGCASAGVIVRIAGRPQDVTINRILDGKPTVVSRPRVLEVMCAGDRVMVTGGSTVTISLDGRGPVTVSGAAPFTVAARAGAPSAAGNAYRALNDQVMPDMKRLAWSVRLKGEGDDFGFATPGLSSGTENLVAGNRSLLVRIVGGVAPYKAELRDPSGALVASHTETDHSVQLPTANLKPGAYRLTITDGSPRSLDATVTVVAEAAPVEAAFADIPDPEVRSATAAAGLAQAHPAVWAFEAEQMMSAAPATSGLDRDRIYELIESYSAE
jgi:hypothetical protein